MQLFDVVGVEDDVGYVWVVVDLGDGELGCVVVQFGGDVGELVDGVVFGFVLYLVVQLGYVVECGVVVGWDVVVVFVCQQV